MSLKFAGGAAHTRHVHWVFLVVVAALTLFFTLSFWPVPALAPYETLSLALTAPEQHVPELWSLVEREDGAGWVARLELSKILLAKGEREAVVVLLRQALALRDASEARKLLGLALEESGRFEEALNEWEKLLPAEKATAAVLRLAGDAVSAARALVAGGACAQALAALSGLNSPEAVLLRAQALAGLGRLPEAAQEYARYLSAVPSHAQAQWEYGRVLERLGKRAEALVAYRASGPLGAYALGRLLEDLGVLDEAIAAYLNSGEPEARWRAACLLETQGRLAEALALYQELARTSTRVADDAASRAYLLLSREKRTEEASFYRALLPPAFLWLLGESVPVPPIAPDPWGSTSEVVHLADALLAHFPGQGEEWAQIALEIALPRATPAEALTVGEWYEERGDWYRAYRVGVEVLSKLPCRRAYRLAYPLAWEGSVRRWAREHGVDPFLVWAVMREESSFIPDAISRSGAHGLMQLLPSTARWIAEEKLGIPYNEELLFQPDYNIRLGTWYLRYLLDQFGGDMGWAVAAYNGGPGNLRRWAGGITDPRDLPKALRSAETREYLVKVLNSWLRYRWLYR